MAGSWMGIRFPGPETIPCLVPFPDQTQPTVEGVRELVPVRQPVNAYFIDISLLHQPQILTTCVKESKHVCTRRIYAHCLP